MTKIITLNLNPSLDRIIYIDNFDTSHVHRPTKVIEEIGGKGLNVSKALSRLQLPTTCIGLIGSNLPCQLEAIKINYPNINTKFIPTKLPSRICSDFITPDGSLKVNENSPKIAEHIPNAIIELINKISADDQIWIISGSLPSDFESNYYNTIIKIINKTNSKIIIDTSGNALKNIINTKPYLIKPNREECEQLLGIEIKNIEDAKLAVQNLLNKGVKNVALSLGNQGLVFGNNKSVKHYLAPKVKVLKTTGAGDGLLAGLVFGIVNGYNIDKMCEFAVTLGSLSTTYQTVEYPSYQEIQEFNHYLDTKPQAYLQKFVYTKDQE
jgi:1-phosphofructokinase family hexose kinase